MYNVSIDSLYHCSIVNILNILTVLEYSSSVCMPVYESNIRSTPHIQLN